MNIFTIGYESKKITEYLEILKSVEVKVLIDVREIAWSYKKDFCKNKFNEALEEYGIKYIHVKELGNPKKIRKSLLQPSEILANYKSYLEETNAGVDLLLALILKNKNNNQSLCLTCFEKDHNLCHRLIILEHIKPFLQGVEVVHL